MDSNLVQATGRDVIERPLTLQAGEASLHRLPLGVQDLPGDRVFPDAVNGHEFLVRGVHVDNRLGTIRPPYKGKEGLAGIPRIGHEIAWAESSVGKLSLTQDIRRHLDIADVACCYHGGYREFSLAAIRQQVEFVSKGELGLSLRSLLDRPSGFGVRRLRLAAVHPSLESCAVDGDPLTEAWKRGVVLANKTAGYIFDQV